MSEPGWITFGGGEEAAPSATITRWADSPWPRLVRGQRVTIDEREWCVIATETDLGGDETYRLELAEIADARIAAGRVQPTRVHGEMRH